MFELQPTNSFSNCCRVSSLREAAAPAHQRVRTAVPHIEWGLSSNSDAISSLLAKCQEGLVHRLLLRELSVHV